MEHSARAITNMTNQLKAQLKFLETDLRNEEKTQKSKDVCQI